MQTWNSIGGIGKEGVWAVAFAPASDIADKRFRFVSTLGCLVLAFEVKDEPVRVICDCLDGAIFLGDYITGHETAVCEIGEASLVG